ncbi:endo-beta-1 like protein [Verticillium longisporum]|uniref:lytic cellulose monooxygenase (C4-dehydrogenating) n=1 Tax=Verticillium longisporum TaxID=100787 RepID=A0A8I3AMV3_VERLO|nr:endo-beta-1 like protein [Verticillium longisporum]KAG7127667.1 endo-beta-1 like protein [Verticillium longisporum]KAG7145449.1 endo-beta-1 like protein [Verticillium longisporum]
MKYTISALAFAALSQGHAIFQVVSVNGVEAPPLSGLRAPGINNPVEDVSSNDLTCGLVTHTSTDVIEVEAGDEIGAWYQHVLGGEQYPGDVDNPIAASHKGPITAWLAKVDDAATSSHANLEWFKIAEDGFDNTRGIWGVDNLLQQDGCTYFDIPECIAPGDYLLRVELLALHSAYVPKGSQFYTSCVNLRVTRGGNFAPGETFAIPGVYEANDPAITIMIYGNTGKPDNNLKPYTPAGPRPITC